MAECTQLIVFAKPPVPGLAKTRLSPPLTPEQAAAVHEASLKDVVTKALGTGLDVEIHYAGSDDAGGFFAHAFPTTRSLPQVPGDLGQRLTAAFDHAFGTGADRVLIIGSHSPTLPEEALHAAARAGAGTVVLGPAADGGYYLVGFRADAWPRARPIFRNIPWSSGDVLTTTVKWRVSACCVMCSVSRGRSRPAAGTRGRNRSRPPSVPLRIAARRLPPSG